MFKMREDSPGDGSGFLSAGRAPQFARHLVVIIMRIVSIVILV